MVKVHSLYEYVTIEETITETMEDINRNWLDFSVDFQNMRWAEGELEKISHELVDTAKYFGEQQSLNPNGTLLTHIKAEPRGNTIYFENDAVNDRGQFYAGHVEYGHFARDGKTFVEARPFMRPALYAVSRASTGHMKNILSELLIMPFSKNGKGYQGLNNLTFGHKLGTYSGGPAKAVRSGMLNSKIGKEGFSNQEGYVKKTGLGMSPKRGRTNVVNRALMSDAGWNSRGRSTHGLWYSSLGKNTRIVSSNSQQKPGKSIKTGGKGGKTKPGQSKNVTGKNSTKPGKPSVGDKQESSSKIRNKVVQANKPTPQELASKRIEERKARRKAKQQQIQEHDNEYNSGRKKTNSGKKKTNSEEKPKQPKQKSRRVLVREDKDGGSSYRLKTQEELDAHYYVTSEYGKTIYIRKKE